MRFRPLFEEIVPERWDFLRLLLALACCTACNQATLTGPPDAADEASTCTPHAVEFCDAGAVGCVATQTSDPYVSLLPADAAFPIGCTANVIGTDRDPITGTCKLAATCTCDVADGGDAAAWICTP